MLKDKQNNFKLKNYFKNFDVQRGKNNTSYNDDRAELNIYQCFECAC